MHFKHLILILLLLGLLPKSILAAQDLASTQYAASKLDDPQTLLIDLRKSSDYELGHLRNAINIPLATFHRKKDGIDGFVQTPSHFKNLMETSGIRNDQEIILYSDWSFLDSARVYWIFQFYGHQNIKVLNGGFQAWLAENRPVSQEEASRPPSQYMVEVGPDILSTKFQTFMATKNSDFLIVDARPETQFQGKRSLTQRKGHIPTAINLPWHELVENRDETDGYDHLSTPTKLIDLPHLKQKLAHLPQDKKIILYCNGGQESSVLYFALKSMGVQASVYDGSWFEWSDDETMPVTSPSP